MGADPKSSEKGLVLIITLLITALLVTVVTEIVYTVHIHTSMTYSFKDSQKASLLAEGGVKLIVSYLQAMTKERGYTPFKNEDTGRVLAEGDGVLSVRAEDEQGKVSVNAIVFGNGETNVEKYAIYSRLLEGLALKTDLADTLADWIDIDDDPRVGGAESHDYYKRLTQPYSAKGAPLDSTEELLLVKGYTPNVVKKLSTFITVYTNGKININTAPKEVIMALSDELTEDMAQRVIDYRYKYPFKDTAEIRKVSGFEILGFDLQNRITVTSNIFRVFSKADMGGHIREIEAVVQTTGNKIRYWRER